jgi:hypothetical protein
MAALRDEVFAKERQLAETHLGHQEQVWAGCGIRVGRAR